MSDIYTDPPQSRNEAIIKSTIDGTQYTDPPQSRMEDLLLELKETIEQGGGGGTTVVANPEGEATDELKRIQVGSDIYGIPKDYEDLDNKPQINGETLEGNKTASDLGLQPTLDGAQTVEGNPITVADAEAMNAESVKVELEPKQDLHGYDKPWAGGAGKNKFDKSGSLENGKFIQSNGNIVTSSVWNTTDYQQITPNTYTMSGAEGEDAYYGICWYDSERTYIGGFQKFDTAPQTVTIPSNAQYIRYSIRDDSLDSFMLEQGSTATTYEPYSNICPISGYSEVNVERVGKNLLDINASGVVQNAMFHPQTLEIVGSENYDISDYIEVKEGVTYKYSRVADSLSVPAGVFYDKDKNPISFKGNIFEMTIPSGIKYVRLELLKIATNQQFEVGSSETTYEPYQGDTYTIDLDGTKYGGTLDVTNGVLTVTHSFITYSGSDVDLYSDDYENVRYARVTKAVDSLDMNKYTTNCITSMCRCADIQVGDFDNPENIGLLCGNIDTFRYWIALDKNITLQEAQNLIDGLQLVYELATPLTIQLTPAQIQMLENTNNISTDGTNITLKYQPNNVIGECKAYTDEKIDKVLPPLPTTDGTYHLSCEVTSGVGVLSWVSDS